MRMCVIVPSRGRPQNLERLADAFIETEAEADLFAIIDLDDPKGGEYSSRFYNMLQHNITGGSVIPIAYATKQLLDDSMFGYFDYFMYIGDDALPKTKYWDRLIVKPLLGKTGITYGNDLLRGAELPTHFCITRDIARLLTKYGWPQVTHLYIDNFIKQLGIDIGSLYYNSEIIIEHLHPMAGKAKNDEGYMRVNRPELYENDLKIVNEYLASPAYADLVNELK